MNMRRIIYAILIVGIAIPLPEAYASEEENLPSIEVLMENFDALSASVENSDIGIAPPELIPSVALPAVTAPVVIAPAVSAPAAPVVPAMPPAALPVIPTPSQASKEGEITLSPITAPPASSAPKTVPELVAPAQGVATPAAVSSAIAAVPLSGYIEVGGNYHSLRGLPDNWVGGYVRGNVKTDPENSWDYQIENVSHFGKDGTYFSVGNTHSWDDEWYAIVSAGGSVGGFFFPRYRLDGFLYKKWLEKKNLINYIGIGGSKSKTVYSDASLAMGLMYYFDAPILAEIGTRINESNPGSVHSVNSFLALTYGKNLDYYLTLRYAFGNEAYQLLADQKALVDFNSNEISLNIRRWLNPSWGVNARAEYYSNSFYQRTGTVLGVFKEF
jgi:YaiO family outer membrane protein